MARKELQISSIEGKTYTLFGNSTTTTGYFQTINVLADKILENYPDINSAVEIITRYSSKKSYLRKIILNPVSGFLISDWMNIIDPELRQFTQKTDEHLKKLPVFKYWDKRLASTREQYHLYMLEIELTNRLYSVEFNKADRKIALLPYCLRDFSATCKASENDFDDQ